MVANSKKNLRLLITCKKKTTILDPPQEEMSKALNSVNMKTQKCG